MSAPHCSRFLSFLLYPCHTHSCASTWILYSPPISCTQHDSVCHGFSIRHNVQYWTTLKTTYWIHITGMQHIAGIQHIGHTTSTRTPSRVQSKQTNAVSYWWTNPYPLDKLTFRFLFEEFSRFTIGYYNITSKGIIYRRVSNFCV